MPYTDPADVPRSAQLALLGALLVLVASVLPWFADAEGAVSGYEHLDGYLTAGMALAAVGAVVGFEWNAVARSIVAVAGLGALLVCVNTYSQAADAAGVDLRPGFWLLALGAAVLLVAAGLAARGYLGSGEGSAPGARAASRDREDRDDAR